MVSAGYKFIILVTDVNNMYSMGDNTFGQLGIDTISDDPCISVGYTLTKIECSNLGLVKMLKCG